MRGTCYSAGETARVIALGNRPGVLARIQFDIDGNVIGLEAEHVGNNLGEHGDVSLSVRHRCNADSDRAEEIDTHCRAGDRAIFRAGFGARLFGHHGGDVTHVRYRRLDDGSVADAVQTPLRTRRIAFFQ